MRLTSFMFICITTFSLIVGAFTRNYVRHSQLIPFHIKYKRGTSFNKHTPHIIHHLDDESLKTISWWKDDDEYDDDISHVLHSTNYGNTEKIDRRHKREKKKNKRNLIFPPPSPLQHSITTTVFTDKKPPTSSIRTEIVRNDNRLDHYRKKNEKLKENKKNENKINHEQLIKFDIPSFKTITNSITACVCATGIYFNISIILIFRQSTKTFSALTYKFLSILALLDLIGCIVVLPYLILSLFVNETLLLRYIYNYYVLFVFLPFANLCVATAAIMTVLVAIERLVSVRWPTKKIILFRHNRTITAILCIFLIALILNLPNFFSYGINHDVQRVRMVRFRYPLITTIKEAILRIGPIFILAIVNSMLIATVRQSRHRLTKRAINPQRLTKQHCLLLIHERLNGWKERVHFSKTNNNKKKEKKPNQQEQLYKKKHRQERQLTLMTIMFVCVFIVASVPMCIVTIYSIIAPSRTQSQKFMIIKSVVNLLEMLHLISNYTNNYIFNTTFRNAVNERCQKSSWRIFCRDQLNRKLSFISHKRRSLLTQSNIVPNDMSDIFEDNNSNPTNLSISTHHTTSMYVNKNYVLQNEQDNFQLSNGGDMELKDMSDKNHLNGNQNKYIENNSLPSNCLLSYGNDEKKLIIDNKHSSSHHQSMTTNNDYEKVDENKLVDDKLKQNKLFIDNHEQNESMIDKGEKDDSILKRHSTQLDKCTSITPIEKNPIVYHPPERMEKDCQTTISTSRKKKKLKCRSATRMYRQKRYRTRFLNNRNNLSAQKMFYSTGILSHVHLSDEKFTTKSLPMIIMEQRLHNVDREKYSTVVFIRRISSSNDYSYYV
ncbi:hypothetical protein SNEBB_000958 [Seison nebaliae]|nr:hypothetical protein SNEBB_000958 [Seison nebaliae]